MGSMGFSARHAFVDSRGQIHVLTQKRHRELRDGRGAEPDFVSRQVRMASVYVELEGRRAVRIVREDYEVVVFGADGALDIEAHHRKLKAVASRIERRLLGTAGVASNVVEAEDRFVLASSAWSPTSEQRTCVLEACRLSGLVQEGRVRG